MRFTKEVQERDRKAILTKLRYWFSLPDKQLLETTQRVFPLIKSGSREELIQLLMRDLVENIFPD